MADKKPLCLYEGDLKELQAGDTLSPVSDHELAFDHGDIAHINRAALDLVSGTNTGDQDLSGLLPHTGGTLTDYKETAYTATTATDITLNLANGNVQRITLGGNHQITMPAGPVGLSQSFALLLLPVTFTPTWAAAPAIKWFTADGLAPTLEASDTNVLSFIWDGGSSQWLGFTSGVSAETDPVFTAWDKSTGVSITESQISDFGTYEPADSTILKDADIGVTVQGYDANLVSDASYVHTDSNYTTTEKTKLSGIAGGAEVNVNADWNAVDGDAEILNKPTLGTAATQDSTAFEPAGSVSTHNALTGTAVHGLGTASTADVTTSATNTTVGRLLKVGDFGLGQYGLPDFSDFNSTSFFPLVAPPSAIVVKSGFSPANKPGLDNYWITEVKSRALSAIDIRFVQTATTAVESNSPIYIRHVTNSNGSLSFGTWKKVYNQTNILGTVSQLSGVPTGAIIERGSNANGEYVKFADGTMICTRTISVSVTLSVSSQGGYRNISVPMNFAAEFSSIPAISLVPLADQAVSMSYASIATAQTNICFNSITEQPESTRSGYLIAIGRWF